MKGRRIGRYLATLALMACSAQAEHTVIIWPVDPIITHRQKASELWVENRGGSSTLLQVRIFGWSQSEGANRYSTQQRVIASPPMLRLAAGEKHLIRLIKGSPPLAGQEQAYRILIDEIPDRPAPDAQRHSLTFQMRYSLPLFVYGEPNGARRIGQQTLNWRTGCEGGKGWIEISNAGTEHIRLSQARLGARTLASGLFDYVLANTYHRWPLDFTPTPGAPLEVYIDNHRQLWRGKAP